MSSVRPSHAAQSYAKTVHAAPASASGSSRKRTPTYRRPSVIGAILSLMLVFILASFHIDSVDAEILITASEMVIVLDSSVLLTRPVEIKSARIRDVATLRVPNFRGVPEALLHPADVGLTTADTAARIAIEPLGVAAGDTVRLTEPTSKGLTVGIHASRADRAMTFAVVSSVVLAHDAEIDTLHYRTVKVVSLTRQLDSIDAVFSLADTTAAFFAPNVPVRSLVLHRLNRTDAAQAASSREESTLRSIGVHFVGYEMTPAVHPAEIVRLSIARNARVRSLRMTPAGIEASFAGTISRLSFGNATAMPSYLEAVAKGLRLRLMYATFLFVSPVFAAIVVHCRSMFR